MDLFITENFLHHDFSDVTITTPYPACPNSSKVNPYEGPTWQAVEITMWCVLGLSILFR